MRKIIIIALVLQITLAHTYIPYQAHGFNDLDYFIQLLIKGVNYFKLDLSPVVQQQCLEQSNWDTDMNECENFKSGFRICCLAFRGDTSSIPIFKQPFNHSTEFIDLLRNPKYNHILKKGAVHPYDHKIKIAINFQYNEVMAKITTSFIYSFMKTIDDLDLDIEFITGSDDIIFSYVEKCQLGKCDEVEKYIAKSPIYLQSGSYFPEIKFGEQRFRNFNAFYKTIDRYCDEGFPAWIEKYDEPMIFWEPSHEYQIQYTRERWESPDCNVPAELKKKERFRLSSNLEPEMVQIYWKKPVFNITPSFDPEDQKVVLFGDYYDSAIDHSSYCDYLILALNKQPKTENQAAPGGILKIYNKKFELVQEIQVDFHIKFARSQQDKLLVQGENDAILFTFEKLGGNQCTIKSQEPFSMNDYEILALSHNSNVLQKKYRIIQEIVFFDMDKQTIKFTFYDITTKKQNGEIVYEMEDTMKTPTLDVGFDAFYSNATKTYHIAITFTKYGLTSENNLKLQNQVKIYLSLLEVSQTYQIIDHLHPVHHIDFGKTNDVKFFEYNDQMYLLAIHSNGLCQSAILLNNNDWNKCIYENFEQYQSISNVPDMINYFWGKLDDIKSRVETGHKINGCDLKVMHAKIANGKDPAITLRVTGDKIEAFVVADFVPYQEQSPFTQLFCGSSNDFGEPHATGAMLFSFDLVHPREFDQI